MLLRFKFILQIILISSILTTIWFKNGLIIGKGEEGLNFYNLSKNLELSKTIWVEINTGAPFVSWLPKVPFFYFAEFLNTKLFLPQFLIQAMLFFLLMVTGALSVYYLTLSFLKNSPKKELISLLASIFYLLNPFSISQVWGRWLYPQFFSFALFPLSLLILVKALDKRNHLYLIPLLFSSVLFSWAYGFVTTPVSYWVILGLYFVWWLLTNRPDKRSLLFGVSFIFLAFLGWGLVNAWWILPLIFEGNKVLSSYVSNPGGNIETLLGVSRSYPLDVIVRLLHKGYFFDASAYSPIYSTLPFQLISFLPIIFVLIGLVKLLRKPEVVKFGFFVMLLIIGLFVSLGANPPSGWLFVRIFETISPVQAFRNPFEKFGLVYALGYAPFFALGLATFFKKKAFFWIIGISFLVFGVYAWPMWTGRILAGIDERTGVKVPSYYEDLNKWLEDNDTQNYRILMTPLQSGEGAVFEWGDTIYNGVDPMHFILNRAAISNGAQIPFYFDFVQAIRKYIEREEIAPALSLLRTKFLIDRADMAMVTDSEKMQYSFLTSKIFPPFGRENNLKTICQDMMANSQINGLAWITCQIPKQDRDLSKVKYLHMKVKSSQPANLEMVLRDTNDARVNWHGRVDSDYRTDSDDWQYITLPLSAPTESDSRIDLSKSDLFEIWAYSQGNPEESVRQIDISEIKLDEGGEKELNEFRKVAEFGKLAVFEPVNFNPPPEFGSLSSVEMDKDFAQLYTETYKKRHLTDTRGFVLIPQNPGKNLADLPRETSLEVIDKYKISDARYWVKVNQDQGKGLLLLSKTFNPEWKVLPGVSKEKLSGNLFDDFNLLKAAFLPEKNHFVVNGYANLWVTQDNQDQLAIVFLPQIYADIGLKISVVSVSILILISGILSVRRFLKWKH